MTLTRYIPYSQHDVGQLIVEYRRERGFLGQLPFLIPKGRLFGMVEAGPEVPVNVKHGHPGKPGSRDRLIAEFSNRVFEGDPSLHILVQDIWASEGDYQSERLSSTDKVVIDECVYLRVQRDDTHIQQALRGLVSYKAVVIYYTGELADSTSALVSHVAAAAVEAFDGQGWLLWFDRHLVNCGRPSEN